MTATLLSLVSGLLLASVRVHGPWGIAYGPQDTSAPRPAIVYLHGMWASPEDSCAYFERAATAFGFLVCPRGNAPLGDGRMWAGTYASVAPSVHAALRAAEAIAPGKLDRMGGGTLIGYSNGAYFAVQVARAEPGRWPGLVLLSMRLDLDAASLRGAGVRRVVLAAGERDGARAGMQSQAEGLRAAGLDARFITLGAVGHELPSDMASRMCAAIAWVREADSAICGASVP